MREIPVTLGRTALQPLDSFTCPAVVVEISPLSGTAHVTALSDPAYQDRIVAAIGRGRRTMAARLEAATVISRGQRILFWTLLVSSVLMAVVLLRMRERAHGPAAGFGEKPCRSILRPADPCKT